MHVLLGWKRLGLGLGVVVRVTGRTRTLWFYVCVACSTGVT